MITLVLALIGLQETPPTPPSPPSVAPGLDSDVFQHPLAEPRPAGWQEVSKRLRAKPVFRAKFEQKKKLVALKRPLRSSGEFLFCADRGVCWDTLEPHPILFVLSPRGLFQKVEGEEPVEVKAADQPMVRQMSRVFLSLFSGDEEQLLENFQVFFSGDEKGWELGLEPRGSVMKKVITRIVLAGRDTIHSLTMIEASGDRTEIEFEPRLGLPAELTPEEERRLGKG